jgi:hypothetical protein
MLRLLSMELCVDVLLQCMPEVNKLLAAIYIVL